MTFAKTLSRDEMKNVTAGSGGCDGANCYVVCPGCQNPTCQGNVPNCTPEYVWPICGPGVDGNCTCPV